jgi:hypothetical protein
MRRRLLTPRLFERAPLFAFGGKKGVCFFSLVILNKVKDLIRLYKILRPAQNDKLFQPSFPLAEERVALEEPRGESSPLYFCLAAKITIILKRVF